MKRALLGVLTALFVLSAGTMDVSAAGGHHGYGDCHGKAYCGSASAYTEATGKCSKWKVCCESYCDDDRDGCCDNCGATACCSSYCDEDRDGVCDSCDAVCRVRRKTTRKSGCGRRCHR